MTHTPGPWTIERDTRWIMADSFTVCRVGNQRDLAVIAAAPDMYEALQAIAEESQHCRTDNGKQRRHMGAIAQAALAKAEGRE